MLYRSPGEQVLRERAVTVRDGSGVIEVRGAESESESALYLSGAPMALEVPDCRGSVGRFAVRIRDLVPESVRHLELAAASGFADEALFEQAEAFVRLFAPGQYRLRIIDLDAGWFSPMEEVDQSPGETTAGYYMPEVSLLITTQPVECIDLDCVEAYLERIERGERPALLVASQALAPARFVLDGHHKFEAYLYACVAPRILEMERLDPAPIPDPDALQLLKDHRWLRYRAANGL